MTTDEKDHREFSHATLFLITSKGGTCKNPPTGYSHPFFGPLTKTANDTVALPCTVFFLSCWLFCMSPFSSFIHRRGGGAPNGGYGKKGGYRAGRGGPDRLEGGVAILHSKAVASQSYLLFPFCCFGTTGTGRRHSDGDGKGGRQDIAGREGARDIELG